MVGGSYTWQYQRKCFRKNWYQKKDGLSVSGSYIWQHQGKCFRKRGIKREAVLGEWFISRDIRREKFQKKWSWKRGGPLHEIMKEKTEMNHLWRIYTHENVKVKASGKVILQDRGKFPHQTGLSATPHLQNPRQWRALQTPCSWTPPCLRSGKCHFSPHPSSDATESSGKKKKPHITATVTKVNLWRHHFQWKLLHMPRNSSISSLSMQDQMQGLHGHGRQNKMGTFLPVMSPGLNQQSLKSDCHNLRCPYTHWLTIIKITWP